MPYPSNQQRYEFSGSDRTTLATIAQSALNFSQAAPLRSAFDAWCAQIIALAPTYKVNPPFPDKI